MSDTIDGISQNASGQVSGSQVLAPETKPVADKQVTNPNTAPREDQQFLEKVAESKTQKPKPLTERIQTTKTHYKKSSDEVSKKELESLDEQIKTAKPTAFSSLKNFKAYLSLLLHSFKLKCSSNDSIKKNLKQKEIYSLIEQFNSECLEENSNKEELKKILIELIEFARSDTNVVDSQLINNFLEVLNSQAELQTSEVFLALVNCANIANEHTRDIFLKLLSFLDNHKNLRTEQIMLELIKANPIPSNYYEHRYLIQDFLRSVTNHEEFQTSGIILELLKYARNTPFYHYDELTGYFIKAFAKNAKLQSPELVLELTKFLKSYSNIISTTSTQAFLAMIDNNPQLQTNEIISVATLIMHDNCNLYWTDDNGYVHLSEGGILASIRNIKNQEFRKQLISNYFVYTTNEASTNRMIALRKLTLRLFDNSSTINTENRNNPFSKEDRELIYKRFKNAGVLSLITPDPYCAILSFSNSIIEDGWSIKEFFKAQLIDHAHTNAQRFVIANSYTSVQRITGSVNAQAFKEDFMNLIHLLNNRPEADLRLDRRILNFYRTCFVEVFDEAKLASDFSLEEQTLIKEVYRRAKVNAPILDEENISEELKKGVLAHYLASQSDSSNTKEHFEPVKRLFHTNKTVVIKGLLEHDFMDLLNQVRNTSAKVSKTQRDNLLAYRNLILAEKRQATFTEEQKNLILEVFSKVGELPPFLLEHPTQEQEAASKKARQLFFRAQTGKLDPRSSWVKAWFEVNTPKVVDDLLVNDFLELIKKLDQEPISKDKNTQKQLESYQKLILQYYKGKSKFSQTQIALISGVFKRYNLDFKLHQKNYEAESTL